MKTTIARSILIAIACFLISCRTTNINSAPPISIPSGLTVQEVKLAILSAIYPEKAPREMTTTEKITDNALRAAFGFAYRKVSQGDWFVEEVREHSVLVGYQNRDHYLRVEYVIESSRVIQRIDGSRNLEQSRNSIHKAVFDWLGIMESRIRQSMGIISSLKADAAGK